MYLFIAFIECIESRAHSPGTIESWSYYRDCVFNGPIKIDVIGGKKKRRGVLRRALGAALRSVMLATQKLRTLFMSFRLPQVNAIRP